MTVRKCLFLLYCDLRENCLGYEGCYHPMALELERSVFDHYSVPGGDRCYFT